MPSIKDFLVSSVIFLDDRKEKIKYIKNTLKDLSLDHCTISLPFTVINKNAPKIKLSKDDTEDEIFEPTRESSVQPQHGHKRLQHKKETQKISSNQLMNLGFYEERRKLLAEDRRKEYNEYLNEKSKLAALRNQLTHVNDLSGMPRGQYRSYGEILDEKREEEKSYRKFNDHHLVIEEQQIAKEMVKKQSDSKVAKILDWEANVLADGLINEPVVPKNRLFETYSSRIRAAKYREELLGQMEEKRKRDFEDRQKERMEELLLEKRIQDQRIKMLKEYEDEQIRLRLKAELMARKQELAIEHLERDDKDLTHLSPPSPVRSPSYHRIRAPKSPIHRKVRASLESKYGLQPDEGMKVLLKIDPGTGKPRYQSPIIGADRNGPLSPLLQRGTSPFAEDVLLGGGRVLTRLSEIRKKMQEDHQKMLEQLEANGVETA